MNIGIVSDSHGRADTVGRALTALRDRGADVVVHCGDVGGPACIRALGQSGLKAYVVAGNMDRPREQLAVVAAGEDVEFQWRSVDVPLGDGRFLAVTHGHDAVLLAELVAGGRFSYVCHGHTHQRRDERIGSVRVINPGALAHANPAASVALLDTEADIVSFIEEF